MRKGKSGSLQDILRLLTLWFNHGAAPEVEAALVEGFGHVSIDTWLVVIPQIVARIHSNSAPVRSLIHQLLVRVGKQHPQALLYPLLVACKSQSASRRGAATAVLENLRRHSALLVEQAQVRIGTFPNPNTVFPRKTNTFLLQSGRVPGAHSRRDSMARSLARSP